MSSKNRWMSINTFVQTLPAPPQEFAWAWALERAASEPLTVHVVDELPIETRGRPNEDELILWFGAPDPRSGPSLFNYLSEDERTRAAKFRFEADRWAFAAAHAGLRALLGPMVLCAPHALRFAAGVNGKPYLDHTGRCAAVQFSISHTRGCVAVAVAGRAVGIDVEGRRPIPDLMAVARTAFAPEGQAALIARSVGTPLFVCRAKRLSGVRFSLRVEQLAMPRTADRDADVAAATGAMQAAFETMIRDAPDQWMWAHRRWD